MSTKIITIDGIEDDTKNVIIDLVSVLQETGAKVMFYRQAEHLDIDTPHKDSYELFESGLDFAMLVTDKHCYIKSRDSLTSYLPLPADIDWVIQDTDVHPADIHLTVTKNNIVTESGQQFPVESIKPLINFLMHNYE